MDPVIEIRWSVSEIAVAAFMHPLLDRLPDDSFRTSRSAGSSQLGRVMPFWYAATLVLLIAAAFVVPAGVQTWLVGTAAGLMAAVLTTASRSTRPINPPTNCAASLGGGTDCTGCEWHSWRCCSCCWWSASSPDPFVARHSAEREHTANFWPFFRRVLTLGVLGANFSSAHPNC